MPDPNFDRETQRIDPATVNGWMKNARNRRPEKPRPSANRREKFLRGPVPLPWLRRAAELPGKALAVGLAIWFLSGLKSCRTVLLTRQTLEQFAVGRKPGYRALDQLEAAGLVCVCRHTGKSPTVTICLDTPTEGDPRDDN